MSGRPTSRDPQTAYDMRVGDDDLCSKCGGKRVFRILEKDLSITKETCDQCKGTGWKP